MLDDTVVSKPFAWNIDLACYQYSSREHHEGNDIGNVNLLWIDGIEHVPVGYCLYAPDYIGKGKNDHFQEMLGKAEKQGFTPTYVPFDGWYGGLDNLKAIREKGWHRMTDVTCNRLVSPTPHQYVAVSDLDLNNGTVKRI